jgi:hypothetical protein
MLVPLPVHVDDPLERARLLLGPRTVGSWLEFVPGPQQHGRIAGTALNITVWSYVDQPSSACSATTRR